MWQIVISQNEACTSHHIQAQAQANCHANKLCEDYKRKKKPITRPDFFDQQSEQTTLSEISDTTGLVAYTLFRFSVKVAHPNA